MRICQSFFSRCLIYDFTLGQVNKKSPKNYVLMSNVGAGWLILEKFSQKVCTEIEKNFRFGLGN